MNQKRDKKGQFVKGFPSWNKGKRYRISKQGPNHHCWRGGRNLDRCGYIRIYSPKHPFAHGTKGRNAKYVFEHRLVMEKHLGRYLKSFEYVHHKNGKRADNRLENLELFILYKNWHHKICPKCGFDFLIK